MTHKSGLYFVFGAWLSFIGLLIGGASLVPVTKNVHMLSPAAVYQSVLREELREATTLPTLGKVIAIDLAGKKLSLYEDGTSTKAFRIIELPEAHSLLETPTGSFALAGKEPQHLSRRSGLWMPYALRFGDNFFIHGVPQSAHGDVTKSAAGVSIELATIDAEEVYDFAEIGGKVIVSGGYPRAAFASSSQYYLFGEGDLPPVSAPSFIVSDIEDGSVLWSRSGDMERRAGKLVSFATALSAATSLDQYKNVRVGELLLKGKASQRRPPSRDDELPLGSLIYPLLFDANQTAGDALAEELGDAKFAHYVSERAHELGMNSTSFTQISGIDESTTSARDLTALFGYIYNNEHFLLDVSLSSDHSLFASSGRVRYRWENKNPWVLRGDVDYAGGLGIMSPQGVGSGMFLFRVPVSEFGERTVSFVVIDSLDLEGDIARMREFVSKHYHYGVRRNTTPSELRDTSSYLERVKSLFRDDIIYDRDT